MFTTSSAGVDLYYDTFGEGEPLILLPGAGQSSVALVETGLADIFAEHFTVILMDFTGLGQSGRVSHMAHQQWVRDVVSVMEAAGVERAHLAGSSLGGRVAARVAADVPEAVETLTVDMPITDVSDEQDAIIDALFRDYRSNMFAEAAPRWHGETWEEAMDFFIAARQSPGFRSYYTPSSFLDRIPAPTLLTRGDGMNPVHPVSQALDWHTGAQRSWLWIEPGSSGDALTQACPQRLVELVVRFVEAARAGSLQLATDH